MALKVKAKEQYQNIGKYAGTYRYVMMPELYTALAQDNVISLLSREFGQSRFDLPNYQFTAHARQYAYDEELALLTRWSKWIDEATPIIEAEPTIEDKMRKAEEINAPKNRKLINAGMMLSMMKENTKTLETSTTLNACWRR